MAAQSVTRDHPQQPPLPKLRTNALREIQYNSITAAADSDASTSGDELDGNAPASLASDGGSYIGVSIGRAQARLTSPTTPAAEKAAAIAQSGGFFGEGDIDTVAEDNDELATESAEAWTRTSNGRGERQPVVDHGRLPADSEATATRISGRLTPPTQASQQHDQPASWDAHQSVSQDAPAKTAKRSRTGTIRKSISSLGDVLSQHKRNSSLGDMSRKLQDFNRHSLPKAPAFLQNLSVSNLLPSFDGSSASKQEAGGKPGPGAGAQATAPEPQQERRERPRIQQRRSTVSGVPGHPLSPVHSAGRPSFDALSLAPSLGDDGRWEDIRQQVNSRKKAISDTIDDIHLPSLPSFGTFNLGPSSRPKATPERGTRPGTTAPDIKSKASAEQAAYPHFYDALKDLTGDIVVLGGYRGSVLKSAGPDNRRLWVPLRVTMNLQKVNLEVGLDKEDEETEESRIVPGKMLSHIGPIDVSRRLLRRLRDCPNAKNGTLRVHEWGYDWRLSPALTSRKFRAFLSTMPCNQPGVEPSKRGAIIVAHSLGGVITRHAVNQQPELFSRVLYAGVPQHAVNILGPLRHGDDVALNSRVLTAQVNFSIRTSFALLPLSGQCFYDANTKEELPVDFFNVEHWKEYRWSPVIARPLAAVDAHNTAGRNSIIDSMAELLSVKATRTAEKADAAASGRPAGLTPQMNGGHDTDVLNDPKDPKLNVTIPYEKAEAYLARTLAETKEFLLELAYRPDLEGSYPHVALIYGKNIPTCRGAKVVGRDGIKRSDAYDNLLFGSGDGVVLARAAMLPEGYRSVKKGVVLSERGHVSLLSDLEAVGRCLSALHRAKEDTDIKGKTLAK